MLIDLHAHHFTPGMLDCDDHWGPHIYKTGIQVGDWILGTKDKWFLEADDPKAVILSRLGYEGRIAKMDEMGVDKLVLSVPSHFYMYWAGDFGTEYAHIVNDELASFCADAPERLYFWGHANVADPASAVKEIDRAVNELGAKGLSIGGDNFGGMHADDERLFPVWEKLCELDVPLFCHGYNQSVTWGSNPPKDTYDSTSIVGMCADEALMFWYMVNGGVFDHFPTLNLFITHGGGFVPYQVQRFQETNLTMAPDSKNKKQVREYLPNIYFDLDLHSRNMRQAMVDDFGAEHILYGTNFGGSDSHSRNLTEDLDLSEADRNKIQSGNALALLHW